MVSVKQLEDNYYLQKQNSGSELSKCSQLPLNGDLSSIEIPIYQLRSQPAKNIGSDGGTLWNSEEQSLLDSLLLAQWEDRGWKGLLRYDVTACETKVISGQRKFIAQLNKEWKSKYVPNLEEYKNLQLLDPFKFNCMKTVKEELLFYVTSGEKAKSELITSSSVVPNDANLVVINENPVEYGHVFFVPNNFHHQYQTLDARSLEMVTVISNEINNCSFRVFYDCPASRSVNHLYFQGCYFANHLPVELALFVPVPGIWQERGIQICEIADYPVKSLLFEGRDNSKALVDVVSEICSYLQDRSTPFSLLISECGTKIFLFPKVHMLAAEHDLSAWECGGHFVFKRRSEFNQATEAALAKSLTSISLDGDGFQSVKQQCCIIASSKLDP